MRALDRADEERARRLAQLDDAMARGIADAGRVHPADQVFDELRQRIQQKADSRGPMKLVFTDEAKADLHQIGEWIAEENPARALTFVDEFETRCARLTTMPRAYPLVPRHVGS